MEILMKLQCSPAAASRSPHSHSTLKVVDHHHQLHQQHIVGHSTNTQSQLPSASAPSNHPTLTPSVSQDLVLPTCLEYTTTMDCCSASQQNIIDLHWEHPEIGAARSRNITMPGRDHCAEYVHGMFVPNAQHSGLSALNHGCCVSYEPSVCTGMRYSTGSISPTTIQHNSLQQMYPLLNQVSTGDFSSSFAYQEPDENFISIDDAKIKGFLMKIGENEKKRREKSEAENHVKSHEPVLFEIIELDDEEASVGPVKQQSPLAESALITKSPHLQTLKENIVARIDLLDSSSDSEPEADEELPFTAAAAVSCELQCDLDETEKEPQASIVDYTKDSVEVLNSDDEENVDFIDELEEGVELRWDDLEETRDKTLFECFLCGKKVQSSYNLRRHMMIHTGERPFGCDLCERRFREFSDLKKHRRRHIHAPNFVCMICRINTPTEHDPTRCLGCDAKNAAALAALRPQMSISPEKSQTPPVVLKIKQPIQKPSSHSSTPSTTPPPLSLTPSKSVSPLPLLALPTLAPIGAASDTQILLDNVPAVHRPSFNQQGVGTRKEFPCPLCQRPFGTRHNLKRHFMIHTGEKPFSCPKCRKPFREYSTLKKHLVTHKRDRWYKCHLCVHKSRDYLKYIEHKTTHPKSESTFSPSKKRSKSKNTLHEDSFDSNEEDSSTEDWLECCECGHRFTDIEAYTEHLKEHDPTVFLYECYICKQTFSERESMVKHVTKHDDDSDRPTEDVISVGELAELERVGARVTDTKSD